ncbi:hypothetical protein O3P69_015902 [Scylla paramamosain]|uniref:Uncharacterized protein n=1 Tax=Scylla paramamosain TaxID=85552 RepID=A0AAW0T8H4_SCYPA
MSVMVDNNDLGCNSFLEGPHTTKKLLRDAIKEYKTIVEYLARLLHAAETHKPPPPTTTTTFHHSTVRRIPYPKNVHPLLPYHPSAPDASSYASPFLSTTSAFLSLSHQTHLASKDSLTHLNNHRHTLLTHLPITQSLTSCLCLLSLT